jgi:hypothetical protein
LLYYPLWPVSGIHVGEQKAGYEIEMKPLQPIRREKGAPIIGPTNPAR